MVTGFIVTSHYDIVEDKPIMRLFGRLDNGKTFEAIVENVQTYFFIKEKDEIKAKKVTHIETEKIELQTLKKEPVVKIITKNPKDVSKLRKLFEDHNIACFEADIRFTRRYFIDKDILSTITINGKEEKGNYTDVRFINPEIEAAEKAIEPKMLSFDLETDEKANKIHSVSLYSDKIKKVIVVNNKAIEKTTLKKTIIVKNEKELIETFLKKVKEENPDILVGWNVIDFDIAVLAKRAKHHNIPFILGRTDDITTTRIETTYFRDSSVNIKGRIVLDGIHLLKSSFVKLDDYKLNTAAKHFLKDTKLIEGDDRFGKIDQLYKEKPQEFIDYNLKDSQLVYDILLVSGIYQLTIQRSLLTGLHMDGVKASIASFDSLYLRELRKKGFVSISVRPQQSEQGIGGFVMESKPGIYNNILVLDFKSLYPSLMRTFNIDPLDYVGTEKEVKGITKKKYIIAPNKAVFNNNKGILSTLLEKLWKEREEARKNKNELARYAIKILMNSMYGVLASPNSRFHDRHVSNAITSFGQEFIKKTAEITEEKGFTVIYGDTDSIFVDPKENDSKKAQQIGKQLEKELNKFIKEHIKKEYERESILELEFEKIYTKFFMPKARGSDVGAKKRYAGLKLQEDGKTKLDFTGLEFVRRDWTEVAKEFQLTLLDLIFADKDVTTFVKTFIKDLQEGKHDKLLIYRKALRKGVDEYTKTTPPHVKAARLLDKITTTIISYVITKEGPQPIEKQTSPLDYNHYIEKQLKPIANSILELKGTTFDNVISGSEQKGLNAFMK